MWVDTASRKAVTVRLLGRDARGALFAAGRLIQLLTLRDGVVGLADDTRLATAPRYGMRGHQIGYRNKANSYDAWDVARYEQYVRDLIIFGTNSIELIPVIEIEDFVQGPHMQETVWDMTRDLSEMIGSYGLDVWLFLELQNLEDASMPAGELERRAQAELDKRRALFMSCPYLDAVMVPGGDPGHTPVEILMPWLERLAKVLHEVHPEATLWVSNQGFEHEKNDLFFDYLATKQPDGLEGVILGPWAKLSLKEMRERTPARYRMRRYPDITHNIKSQYPVPSWDRAFARTIGREGCNVRPRGEAHIHNLLAPYADGFVSYSDGMHDDANKVVWSAMGWDPDADVVEVLRAYGDVFFGEDQAEAVAQGLLMLEENWVGLAAENAGIDKTRAHWENLAAACGDDLDTNWRLQLHLIRALYDAYVREKVLAEEAYEAEAMAALARAGSTGVAPAIEAARAALAKADTPAGQDLRERMEALGLDLFRTIGSQLKVSEPYFASGASRGAIPRIPRCADEQPALARTGIRGHSRHARRRCPTGADRPHCELGRRGSGRVLRRSWPGRQTTPSCSPDHLGRRPGVCRGAPRRARRPRRPAAVVARPSLDPVRHAPCHALRRP